MQLAIRMNQRYEYPLEIFMQEQYGLSVYDAFYQRDKTVLLYQVTEGMSLETIGRCLQLNVDRGALLSFFIGPDYEDANEQEITLDDLQCAYDEVAFLRDSNNIREDADDDALQVAKCAINQAIQLMQSCILPHPYVELSAMPALLVPITNQITGNIIWLEFRPTGSGFDVIVHKQKPVIKTEEDRSYQTAMLGFQFDYHMSDDLYGQQPEKERLERLQVSSWNEDGDPYGNDPRSRFPVLLLDDVQAWKPNEEEK